MKELKEQLEELERLLDKQLSTDPKDEFDWEASVNEVFEQEVDYDDRPYEDFDWNEYAEEKQRKHQFFITHGIEEDVYIDQCFELYNTIGNESQRNYCDITDDFNKAYRVLEIQRKIYEGISMGVDIHRMLEFCDTCLYPEERYDAIKYYINNL